MRTNTPHTLQRTDTSTATEPLPGRPVTDGGRPAFWAVSVYDAGYARTFSHYECKHCEATDQDDPAAIDHTDTCPVSPEWVDEQYRLVTQIDGVGESTARTLLAHFGSAEALADFLAEIPGDDPFAPVRIVELDGFGPDAAQAFVEAALASGFIDAVQSAGDGEVTVDG